MRFLLFSISMLFLFTMDNMAKEIDRPPKDNGRMGSLWLPNELMPELGKYATALIGKYESQGAAYYVLNYTKQRNVFGSLLTAVYKVEDGTASLLGKSTHTFPLGKMVSDKEVLDGLWKDFLARWIREDTKAGIQEKLDAKAGNSITEEEVFYLEQAGFKIPKTARRIKEYSKK